MVAQIADSKNLPKTTVWLQLHYVFERFNQLKRHILAKTYMIIWLLLLLLISHYWIKKAEVKQEN